MRLNNDMFGKTFIFWVAFFIAIIALGHGLTLPRLEEALSNKPEVLSYSAFLERVTKQEVTSVEVQGQSVKGKLKSGGSFETYAPADAGLIPVLEQNKVAITAIPDVVEESWGAGIIPLISLLFFIGIWIFMVRQIGAMNGKGMSFGKSKARLLPGGTTVTFEDVAGIDEARQELQEIVDFLKTPEKFKRLGGKIPKGVLMIGPPGTGKTLLARAIAGEAKVPFFTISGSDFVELYVGVGASRVRDMFAQAKKNAPCIVFVDEIDAVGRHRGAGLGGGNDEREQTLNQLLVEMDGFQANDGIILIAATNRPDVLDPALLRPGRFDRRITVSNPDVKGRAAILKVHLKKVPVADGVDVETVARGTPGFSGADLANLVNEAALLAARRNKEAVDMVDFEDAKDKVIMGAERRSVVMDDQEKRLTAYHEAGHAIASLYLPESDPLHKVTIIPRGRALGVTMQLPEKDKYSQTVTYLRSRLSILFAGRIAEEIVLGTDQITTGASNDIQVATEIARKMVTEWGMSEKMGPVAYTEPEGEVFLGYSISKRKTMGDATALAVDNEIHRIIDAAYETTRTILKKYRSQLDLLAQALIEHETLTGEEVQTLIRQGVLDKSSPLKEKKPVGAPVLAEA